MPVLNFPGILNHSVRVLRRVEGTVDTYGQPAITFSVVSGAGLSCYFWSLSGKKARTPAGQEKIGDFKMMIAATAVLAELDVIEPLSVVAGLTRAEVMWVKGIMDLLGLTHHLEAEIRSL